MKIFHRSTGAAALAVATAGAAHAQEAMYTAAATMPSPGTGVVRTQLHYARFSSDPARNIDHTDRYELNTNIAYGIARAWSISLEIPAEFRQTDFDSQPDDSDQGIEDLDAAVKWRIYKHDSGGVDTVRAAIMGGARFASGDDSDFSSQSINPHIGAVITVVRGRHGVNQDLIFRWNTGDGDGVNFGGDGPSEAFEHGSSYLYRIAPAAFTADSKGAWYITAEVNGIYETNGDYEVRWSPGIMFEGWTFAFEAMLQFPLYHDLDERAAQSFAVGLGLRFSF